MTDFFKNTNYGGTVLPVKKSNTRSCYKDKANSCFPKRFSPFTKEDIERICMKGYGCEECDTCEDFNQNPDSLTYPYTPEYDKLRVDPNILESDTTPLQRITIESETESSSDDEESETESTSNVENPTIPIEDIDEDELIRHEDLALSDIGTFSFEILTPQLAKSDSFFKSSTRPSEISIQAFACFDKLAANL